MIGIGVSIGADENVRDAHLGYEVLEELDLADRLARVHLHPDFGDLHRRCDYNLACAGQTTGQALQSNVPVGIDFVVIHLASAQHHTQNRDSIRHPSSIKTPAIMRLSCAGACSTVKMSSSPVRSRQLLDPPGNSCGKSRFRQA
eukprot:2152620-Rhodomonas_salina.2